MKKLILLLLCFISIKTFAQTTPFFTYEGVLTDSGGTPITTTETVTLQILFNATCVAYEETQSVTPGTNGEFSIIVGTGTRTDSTGNTVTQIFGSSGVMACQSATSQSVTGFATRQLHIRIGATSMSPDVTLTNVPFALNAQKLADKSDTDFVQIKAAANVTQTNVESIFTRYTTLDSILNGDFTSVPTTGITGITNASIAVNADIDRTKLANGTANHVVINNGTGVMTSEAQLAISRGGTALGTAPNSGQILIGNGTGYNFGSVNSGAGIIVSSNSSAITVSSMLVPGAIQDSDISPGAAISRSKIAPASAFTVVINDGSGNFSEEAQLAVPRGGTGNGSFTPNSLIMAGAASTSPLASVTCGVIGQALEWTGFTWSCSSDMLTSGTSGTKVNYVAITGSSTGSPVAIQAAGSDTNLDLNLSGKGLGSTRALGSLVVQGESVGRVFRTTASVSGATTTIDFSTGNLQYTTANCGAFTLNNLRDGATYILSVKGVTSAICSFTASGFTIHLPPDMGPTEPGKHTLFNFIVMGSDVYVSWVPGY